MKIVVINYLNSPKSPFSTLKAPQLPEAAAPRLPVRTHISMHFLKGLRPFLAPGPPDMKLRPW